MTDRQIDVLDRVYGLLNLVQFNLNPHNDSQLLKELLEIIKDQKQYAKRERSE